MSKHTPGPWRHTPPRGAFGHEVSGHDGLICQMNHHPGRQNQAAIDAKLIESAPCLYDFIARISRMDLDNGVTSNFSDRDSLALLIENAKVIIGGIDAM